ncbi:hypothetical protein FOZ63_022404, partial [Perkinsus olseni]
LGRRHARVYHCEKASAEDQPQGGDDAPWSGRTVVNLPRLLNDGEGTPTAACWRVRKTTLVFSRQVSIRLEQMAEDLKTCEAKIAKCNSGGLGGPPDLDACEDATNFCDHVAYNCLDKRGTSM